MCSWSMDADDGLGRSTWIQGIQQYSAREDRQYSDLWTGHNVMMMMGQEELIWQTGGWINIKMMSYWYRDYIIKMRWSWDRLIFIMGIPMLIRLSLYWISPPGQSSLFISIFCKIITKRHHRAHGELQGVLCEYKIWSISWGHRWDWSALDIDSKT